MDGLVHGGIEARLLPGPNAKPGPCVYPVVNAPLATSAILDRTTDSHAARERLAALFPTAESLADVFSG